MAALKRPKTYTEFRVLSSRVGYGVTDKRYRSMKQVRDRIGRLTSPEPWRFYGRESDRLRNAGDYMCCAGTYHDECSCGGLTLAQETAERRAGLPAIEWIRVETRMVTRFPWTPVAVDGGAVGDAPGESEPSKSKVANASNDPSLTTEGGSQ